VQSILYSMIAEEDLAQILANYTTSREQYLAEIKKVSYNGIFKGALYFVQTLIEN